VADVVVVVDVPGAAAAGEASPGDAAISAASSPASAGPERFPNDLLDIFAPFVRVESVAWQLAHRRALMIGHGRETVVRSVSDAAGERRRSLPAGPT
jgi:hypothetical protein